MSRTTHVLLVFAVLTGAGIGLWWWISTDASEPTRAPVEGLTETVSIHWSNDDAAVIEAPSTTDALTALGYAHGVRRGWTAVLWRQTALGRLHAWFGAGVLPIDRHTRRLALARQARASYERLPASSQARLQAYARGINAALQMDAVRQQDPFVFFNVRPQKWAPWHTLVIERLMAWVAASPLHVPPDAPSSIGAFQKQHRRLQRWLHLHGWDKSVAWGLRSSTAVDSPRTALFHRFVSGASALPVVHDVLLRHGGDSQIAAATLPGAPLFLTGTDSTRAWASLLSSSAQITKTVLDSSRLSHRYERLDPPDGNEKLLRIRRLGETLLLGVEREPRPSPPMQSVRDSVALDSLRAIPDTAWVLNWPGLQTASDIPQWLGRAGLLSLNGEETRFRLFEADALELFSDGRMRVRGRPPVVIQDRSRQQIVIGQSHWATFQAESLRRRFDPAARMNLRAWSVNDSSTWAGHLLQGLSPALPQSSRSDSLVRIATSYLQNWNHTYEASSVAATIFDQWMRAYRRVLGAVPTPADTNAYFGHYRQRRAFYRAIDTLSARYGRDIRRWRWERAVPDRRYFPVWSADSLVNADLEDLHATQYAPLTRPGQGHPSTLAGGRSLVPRSPLPPAPTTWSGWTSPNNETLVVRRHHYNPRALFARSYVTRTRPSPIRLSRNRTSHTTRLVPAGSDE